MPTIEEFEPKEATILLDEEGQLTLKFELILQSIFLEYSSLSPTSTAAITDEEKKDEVEKKEGEKGVVEFDIFENTQTLSRKNLNDFSLRTNTEPMSDETFSEILEYLDVLDEQAKEGEERLTFKGFLQLYQLQTESDPSESFRDLSKWGYGLDLELLDPSHVTTIPTTTTTSSSAVTATAIGTEEREKKEKKVEGEGKGEEGKKIENLEEVLERLGLNEEEKK